VAGAIVKPPVYYSYDYGANIVYHNNVVYINEERYTTADEFYGQAWDLANTESSTTVVAESANDWLSLGTFALFRDDGATDTGLIFQLATNKAGQIRGNLVNQDDGVWQVFGAVDTQTQRVALRLADDDELIYECGLWNLTQDTVPMLVHFDAETTEPRTLIRLVNSADDKLAP